MVQHDVTSPDEKSRWRAAMLRKSNGARQPQRRVEQRASRSRSPCGEVDVRDRREAGEQCRRKTRLIVRRGRITGTLLIGRRAALQPVSIFLDCHCQRSVQPSIECIADLLRSCSIRKDKWIKRAQEEIL